MSCKLMYHIAQVAFFRLEQCRNDRANSDRHGIQFGYQKDQNRISVCMQKLVLPVLLQSPRSAVNLLLYRLVDL